MDSPCERREEIQPVLLNMARVKNAGREVFVKEANVLSLLGTRYCLPPCWPGLFEDLSGDFKHRLVRNYGNADHESLYPSRCLQDY